MNKRSLQAPMIFLMLMFLTGLFFAVIWDHLPEVDSIHYFDFADQRSFLSLPNAMDVLTNLSFLVVGIYALFLLRLNSPNSPNSQTVPFVNLGFLLGLSILGTCFGSMYFHWQPSPDSLLWDRLPMTCAFSSLLALVVADRVNSNWGSGTLVVMLPLGLYSVIGYGLKWCSVRPYYLVQFGSLLLIASLSFLRPARWLRTSQLWWGLGLYAMAKIFEAKDHQVLSWTGFISGHSLKHLLAALALYKVISVYKLKLLSTHPVPFKIDQ